MWNWPRGGGRAEGSEDLYSRLGSSGPHIAVVKHLVYTKVWPTFSIKGQIVNILGFASYTPNLRYTVSFVSFNNSLKVLLKILSRSLSTLALEDGGVNFNLIST